jgi:HSP20 family protein
MPITLHRDPRTVLPDLIDWFEEPFLGLRPYLAQPIRIEDYIQDGHYVLRAEIAGVDPAKDLDVTVGDGYLAIHAERPGVAEGKHRSEFRYGSFSRTLPLPAGADTGNVTADYADGILTVKVALKGERAETTRKVDITSRK